VDDQTPPLPIPIAMDSPKTKTASEKGKERFERIEAEIVEVNF